MSEAHAAPTLKRKLSVIAPLALVMAGLTWLVVAGRTPQDEEPRVGPKQHG